MQRLRRVGLTLCAMAIVMLLAASIRFVMSRGVFTSVEERVPAVCRTVDGAVTDLAVDATSKTVFVAGPHGLFSYADGRLTKLSGSAKTISALSVARAPSGDLYLRAVFARDDGRPAVALYVLKPGLSLTEIGRITADVLTDPAALVAVDQDRFYLVNRHSTRSVLGRWLDDTFLLPRAHVLWFDGMKFVEVAEHLNTPSGLAASPDGTHLYVTEDYPRSVVGLTRSGFTGAVDAPSAVSLDAGPQKMTMAGDGSLIVAARPKAGAGAVYRVSLAAGGLPQASTLLYAKKGEEVRAAAELAGHLLIGTDKALKDCSLR